MDSLAERDRTDSLSQKPNKTWSFRMKGQPAGSRVAHETQVAASSGRKAGSARFVLIRLKFIDFALSAMFGEEVRRELIGILFLLRDARRCATDVYQHNLPVLKRDLDMDDYDKRVVDIRFHYIW